MSLNAEQFATIWKSVPPRFVNAQKLINDAAKRTYAATPFLMGKGREEQIQTGHQIKMRIKLDGTSTFRFFDPDAPTTYRFRDSGTNMFANWAWAQVHTTISRKHQLFGQLAGMSRGKMEQEGISVIRQFDQDHYQDLLDGIDDALFAVPNFDKMEARDSNNLSTADISRPYSLWCFLNENTNGLFNTTATGTWTTIQGIDPTDYPDNWVCRQVNYAKGSMTSDSAGILHGLRVASRRARWRQPGKFAEHFEKSTTPSDFCIFTGEYGEEVLTQAKLAMGDIIQAKGADSEDALTTWNGKPVLSSPSFDAAAVFDDGSSGLTTQDDSGAANTGPRYMGVNLNHMGLYWHKDEYLAKQPPIRPEQTPLSRVLMTTMCYNLAVSSLKRHWFLSPATAASAF